MTANDSRTVVLIGAGQLTQRDIEPAAALDPLGMMVTAARRAAEDAGADLWPSVDTVAVVNMIGWHYRNAPRLLAARLGVQPAHELSTTVGGNTPQSLVQHLAAEIGSGRVRLALLAGAETLHTLQRARRDRVTLAWHADGGGEPAVIGDARPGTTAHEADHGLQLPSATYPLFENALRVHYGLGLDTHRAALGQLCSRLSAVAAQNPYAWFPHARSAAEITTVGPDNRMIGFPYPKYMNAIMAVDQSAAVLMTAVATARALGIPPSRWVYVRGAAAAHDLWFVGERTNYHTSPAIRAAGRLALETAAVDIAAVHAFDVYSCFPCAVQIGRDMLGIAPDDPRPLTVTGGLPYHGGPGNNYTMHAIATMMDRLRAAPGSIGLVSGLGWYSTKHAVGVYSTAPPPQPIDWQATGTAMAEAQRAIDGQEHPALAVEASGGATIETYTVLHDRDGSPMRGIVIGRLDDGRRCLANTPPDRGVLERLMATEAIGCTGTVSHRDGMNVFEMDA